MFIKSDKKLKGSLTVEAALVLPIVIITLLFSINMLNIYLVHTSMQQALNNTAKKLSQDSYLVYRFAGEENYQKYINGLQNADDAYKALEDKLGKTITDFHTTEKSIKDTVDSTNTLAHTFDEYQKLGLKEKILNIGNVLKTLGNNINQLIKNALGIKDNAIVVLDDIKDVAGETKEHVGEIIIKSLVDASGGMITGVIVKSMFNNYISDLSVSAGDIEEFNPFQTELNDDGSFTMCITYKYINPFAFINQESFEYSVINRNIRMMQTITVKPFVGKNGTSLIKVNDKSSDGAGDSGDKENED